MRPPDSKVQYAVRWGTGTTNPLEAKPGHEFVAFEVHTDLGKGWLEVRSPDAFANWKVRTARNNVKQDRFMRTGPASYDGIWVERGAQVWVEVPIFAPAHIIQRTGLQDEAFQAAPAIEVRFFPASDPSWNQNYMQSVLSSSILFGPGAQDDETAIGLGGTKPMYPPGYLRVWSFVSTSNMRFRVLSVWTPAGYNDIANSVMTARLAVDPWTFVTLTAVGLSGNASVNWTKFPES